MMNRWLATLVGVAALWSANCTVHQSSVPELTGPSDFATSLAVTATPDRINRDGASQAAVAVTARNASGQALAGLAVRLDMAIGGVLQDFGTLSARSIVTNTDGRATVIYTAPAAPPAGTVGQMSTVTIVATPVGSNAQTSPAGGNFSSADIQLMPVGVILPPADTPTAAFTVTPTPVTLNVAANFDASASCAGPVSGGLCTSSSTITTYSWSFGDGTSGSGKTTTHTFTTTGSFSVTLTVTNNRGVAASTTQTVTVGTVAAPSGDWVFSPTAPVAGSAVQFNAEGVRAAPGNRIDEYIWNFGDGTATASGVVVSHTFAAASTYSVVLTVTDNTGQKTTIAKTVPVGSGNPTASFTAVAAAGSPPGHVMIFDGSASTATGGATITTYSWNFGDGSSGSGAVPPPHTYGAAGPVVVTLTVTDSQGRTGSKSAAVTVP